MRHVEAEVLPARRHLRLQERFLLLASVKQHVFVGNVAGFGDGFPQQQPTSLKMFGSVSHYKSCATVNLRLQVTEQFCTLQAYQTRCSEVEHSFCGSVMPTACEQESHHGGLGVPLEHEPRDPLLLLRLDASRRQAPLLLSRAPRSEAKRPPQAAFPHDACTQNTYYRSELFMPVSHIELRHRSWNYKKPSNIQLTHIRDEINCVLVRSLLNHETNVRTVHPLQLHHVTVPNGGNESEPLREVM